MTVMTGSLAGLDLRAEIDRLRKERNAVILAHYYQVPEIQDLADFVGDSLDLSRKAAATDAEVIGKTWLRFEGKAWLLHLPQRPWFVGLAAGLITLLVLGLDSGPRRREDEDEATVEAEDVEAPATDDDFLTAVGLSPKVPAQRTDSTPAPVPATSRRFRRRVPAPVEEPALAPRVDRQDGPR